MPPISVGTRGEWYVHAPDVLGLHLFVAFDGRMVHVAAAHGARVSVGGVDVSQQWTPVPVRTEVRFGDATLAVTCEEVPPAVEAPPLGMGFTTAPPPPPNLIRTLIVREPKPAPVRPVATKTVPVLSAVVTGGTQPLAVPATAMATSAPASPRALPSVVETAILSPVTVEGPGNAPALRPVALEPPPSAGAGGQVPSTMFDGGALRDHAHRIATLPPQQAHAATQEYEELLKRRTGRRNSDAPPLAMSVNARGSEEKGATSAPGSPGDEEASIPMVGGATVVRLKAYMARSWKETSNVKKAILFLLPLAAAAVVYDEDPEPRESPSAEAKPQTAAAAPAKRTASHAPATAPSAAPVASAVATAKAAASAAPAASPVVATVAPATSSAAAGANGPNEADPNAKAFILEHRALAAAFGGNLTQASSLYEKLAAAQPESRMFALAARLTKRGAVRTP